MPARQPAGGLRLRSPPLLPLSAREIHL